jgi:hypothetical protein
MATLQGVFLFSILDIEILAKISPNFFLKKLNLH